VAKKARANKNAYEAKSPGQIKAAADDLRQQLGITGKHAPDLAHVLNLLPQVLPNFKLKVVEDSELPNEEAKAYSAACMLKVRKAIMTALRRYGDATARFIIAHELGHLYLKHPGNRFRRRRGRTVPIAQLAMEFEASLFASEFLLPADLVDITLSTGAISRIFQVSTEVAERRKREISRIIKNTTDQH
jgi:Zn-dependent peptidase ImmA (M78 family)